MTTTETKKPCGCGHCHTSEHEETNNESPRTQDNDKQKYEDFYSPTKCGCGHNHEHGSTHEHEHKRVHEHKPARSKVPTISCGCGCGHDDSDDDGTHDGHSHDGHSHDEHSHDGHSSEDGHSHDKPATNIDWALWIGGVALFILAMVLPVPEIVKAILFGISVLISGWQLLVSGLKEIVRFKLQENSLLLIAVVASFWLLEYPEACVVTLLFRLGGFLEAYAIAKSRKSMEALSQIRPETATVKNGAGEYIQVAAEDLEIGDTYYLRAGDRVPLDCVVTSGFSTIDSSALTGESLPISAETGDSLLSGSVNLTGVLTCSVVNTFENSAASQIIEMVYASTKKKGKAENLVSRFAKYYTPAVVIIALLIALVPPLFFGGSYPDFIGRALIFLVASCPCSLVISIPLTFFSAIGATSKSGVLVKGSLYIEKLAKIKAVCLDKTGTLTSGKMTIASVLPLSDISENEVLRLSSALEAASSHPIARSIVAHAASTLDSTFSRADFSDLAERPGMGVSGKLDGVEYYCGGARLLTELGIKSSSIPIAQVYLCAADRVLGAITLKEEIPEQSITLASNLKKEGVEHIVMLTGDNEASAKLVADACSITEYHAGLLPADKVSHLEALKGTGATTLFVGDGINDAPVLATADIGVAMGLGSEIANASADVILVSNNLWALPRAIKLAKRGMSVVYFNFGFAFAIKLLVLILGATGNASMWMAVFADIGVTILSVLNSVRLLKKQK